MFPLSNFLFTGPTLLLSYKLSFIHAVFGVEPSLFSPLQNFIAVVPIPIEEVPHPQSLPYHALTSVIEYFFPFNSYGATARDRIRFIIGPPDLSPRTLSAYL